MSFGRGEYFVLFANCIPVRGARRSIICDLLLRRYQLIPNDLCEILSIDPRESWDVLASRYSNGDQQTLRRYFDKLEEQELGFWTTEPDSFPPLSREWDDPAQITNAVVDIGPKLPEHLDHTIDELFQAGCTAIQLRFFAPPTIDLLGSILELCSKGGFRSIDLLLPFESTWSDEILRALLEEYQAVSSMMLYDAPETCRRHVTVLSSVVWQVKDHLSNSSCGHVGPQFFAINFDHFLEAQWHNTCLNRKISIDTAGNVRGCPSMTHIAGNVKDTRLATAVQDPVLVQLASITKDQVAGCRECEFRYICTDCRIFTQDPANLYSKPLHCNYDPAQARWNRGGPA